MTTRIQLRRGTAAQWTSADPTLALGEAGIETDTLLWKVGDGVTIWSELPYMADGGGGLPLANGTSNFNIATANGNATVSVAGAYTWTFGTDGNVTIPGDIISLATIDIDNRASGNGADINLYSADDITIQARDRTLGSFSEGGDINIYAGDSAEDGDSSGGDVTIEAGRGGAANVDFGGSGGVIRIESGQGGDASTGVSGDGAYNGGSLTLRAGAAGSNNGNIDRGASGGDVYIESGDSTANAQNGGNIYLNTGAAGGDALAGVVQINIPGSDLGTGGTWSFDGTGQINVPADSASFETGRIQSANGYPTLLGYGSGEHGGPELDWMNGDDVTDLGNANVLRNTLYINDQGLYIGINENNVANVAVANWQFAPNGTTIFPTLEVDIHNGGVQSAQTLQFGGNQQAIITGPTPDANVSAQRIIIQGQRGNGTGEGGDVYVWAGDADTNGGDIKIYAGDADNVSAGQGGYVNIDGGAGFDQGGTISLTGGYSANAYGGAVNINGGSGELDGGSASLQGGYGANGQGGTVQIVGGAGNSQAAYGNVEIGSGSHAWLFNNSGNLVLPSNTFAVNYANGTPVSIGGGSGVSIVPNDVTYTNGSLYGNANPGFTVVTGQDDDDDAYNIPVDFPIEFLGNSYSTGNVFLVSNSYLTFGPDGADYTEYHPVGPVVIPVPAIYIGAMDLSNQKYYYGYADGTDVFVIGYEGSIETSGQENHPAIQWELQVNSATPDQIKIVVDGPANNGGALNFPAGVWGISNGAVWIDQYQPLPWYSNNNDDTYNAITIAPVVPVAVSTIAFTGPGVTYSENGGTTYINIDPFDEAISVGYDDDSDEAIISSVYYGLTLTTAQDGEQLTLAPLGDVNISAGSASDNQPGGGYQVNIYGGNAHDDPNTPGQTYDGGQVNITGGNAVGNGVPGAVRVTSNGNTWTFASTGNLTLPNVANVSINYANGQPYGGSGSANTGNVTFDDVNIIGTGNLNLQPNGSASEYLNIYLTGSADIHVAYGGGSGNVILGTDEQANVAVLQDGNVAVQAGNVAGTQTWTFGTDGTLTTPSLNAPVDRLYYGLTFTYGSATIDFVLNANGTFSDIICANGGGGYSASSGSVIMPGTQLLNGASPANDITWDYVCAENDGVITSFTYASGTPPTYYNSIESGLDIGISANSNVWTFGQNGTLTIPGAVHSQVDNNLNFKIYNASNAGGSSFDVQNFQIDIDAVTTKFDVGASDITLITDFNNVGYTWNFDNTGNLTIPGNILGSGNILIAPDSASASSYLDIYLTGGPDIHIASNDSSIVIGRDTGANVFVGNDGEVSIRTDNGETPQIWNFTDTGNLTLPGNTFAVNYANGDPVTFSGGSANTGNVTFSDQAVIGTGDQEGGSGLYLAPGTESVGNLQYIRVRGGDVATHIHLDTGNNAYFDQYFGSDIKYVKLEAAGNVQIGSNDDTGNSASWTFGVDGNLTTPSNLVIGPGAGSGSRIFQYDEGLEIVGEGANSVVLMGWTANTSAPDSVATIAMNYPSGGEGNILIAVGNNATTVNYWLFDNTGNLTLPGNTFAVNYANGNPVSISGGASTGNVTFNDINIIGTGNLKLQPNSANADAYLDIYLTSGPDIHIAGNGETVILGTDDFANVTVNVDGNVSIQASNGTPHTWTFDTAGNLTLPGNIIAINYANGNRVTGNVTFRDEIVIGTGTSNVISGLYLSPSSSSADANMYLRVRGNVNDEPTHIHFDTGNNQYYNQFIGDDNKYIQLANTGNIVINTNDMLGNTHQWSFDYLGTMYIPGNIKVTPNNDLDIKVYNANASGAVSFTVQNRQVDLAGAVTTQFDVTGNSIVLSTDVSDSNYQWTFDNAGNLAAPGVITATEFSTSGTGGDIVLTGGNIVSANVISANTVSSTGNVQITSSGNTWNFDTTGNLTFPTNNLVITPKVVAFSNAAVVSSANNLITLSTGVNGGVSSLWVQDYANIGTSNIAAVYANPTAGSGNVRIAVGTNGGSGPNLWDFDRNGNLSAPGNVSAVGNVIGAYIVGNGSELTNLPAPVVTQDITSNGVMSIMTYDGNIKYVNYATVEPSSGNIAGGNISASGNVTTAGWVVTTPMTLANLTAVAGARAFVNNGNLAAVGNFGAQIGSGGSNIVPVWSDGTNWYIG